MVTFFNPHISIAAPADSGAIKDLLNKAYRGEASKQGWTTEADLIEGDIRTDDNMLKETMELPGSVFLIYKDDTNTITSCVNLQQQQDKIYLGMFSVSPQMQGAGIGKQILKASEEYALQMNCRTIYMTVISARSELIDWYKRHGYAETGETKNFKEDAVTGKHKEPLQFLVLEKVIAP